MERRNTIQREMVLNAVKALGNHPTAEEVFLKISTEHSSIGKGTVYRNLHILAEEGMIRRVEIPEGPDHFDHTLEPHYHVRCICCNKVSDVEMEMLSDLKQRIHNNHGVKFLDYDILFKGICSNCQKEDKEDS